jgi:hypothetical protein
MTTKFNNRKAALEEAKCVLLTSEEEFKKTGMFRFRCSEGHETEQKHTSLNNRISTWKRGECLSICGKCCLREPVLQKLKVRLTELGFELVRLYDDNLTLEYRCKCGEVSKTNTKNMHKASRQSSCNKCGNMVRAEKKQEALVQIPKEKIIENLPNGYKCLVNECNDYAYLGGEDRPSYCLEHASVNCWFINYKFRMCITGGCEKQSTFNFKMGQRPIFCIDHKQPQMINVKSIKCETCGERPARFNTKQGYPKALFCKYHKKDDMIDCLEKLCNPPHCWRQGTFGYNRFDKNRVCKEHRKDGMKDVKNVTRICNFIGCDRQANYNMPDQKRAVRCKDHKEVGMIDMYHDRCLECLSRCVYNYPGEIKGKYCALHKKELMVDVVSSKCQYEYCIKQAGFNYSGQKTGIFCDQHKLNGMVDIKNRNCRFEKGCTAQAAYGFIGQKASRCRQHSEKGMMKYSNRRCDDNECKEKAQYGFEGCYPIYCEIHADKDKHINLIEQECKACGLMNILRDGLCLYCNPLAKREVLKKQNDVKEWLQANGYKIVSYDKRIDGGACGSDRPDFVLETSSGFFVVLEVDEYQHFSYTPECENTRMINISQSLGGPTMFIRYNPDKYTVSKTKQNIRVSDRYKILKKWLDRCLTMSVESVQEIGFCSFVRVFYNEFDENKSSWETLLEFDT